MFLDDYNCALRRKVVLQVRARSCCCELRAGSRTAVMAGTCAEPGHPATRACSTRAAHSQGRMYIFDHYVCFSSFLFGFAKKVVIPLEVRRAARRPAGQGTSVIAPSSRPGRSHHAEEEDRLALLPPSVHAHTGRHVGAQEDQPAHPKLHQGVHHGPATTTRHPLVGQEAFRLQLVVAARLCTSSNALPLSLPRFPLACRLRWPRPRAWCPTSSPRSSAATTRTSSSTTAGRRAGTPRPPPVHAGQQLRVRQSPPAGLASANGVGERRMLPLVPPCW